MEWVCEEHGLPKIGLCEWCSKPICEECMDESHGKKYCFKCLAKLPLDKLGTINRSISARSKENIDPSLSPDAVEEKKKQVEMKIYSDRELFRGVKNIDKSSEEDVIALRKKREDYEKMKKKFNI
jgi:hypothetical protein